MHRILNNSMFVSLFFAIFLQTQFVVSDFVVYQSATNTTMLLRQPGMTVNKR